MPLQHYDQQTKLVVPGAATNDILVYNGGDWDAKNPNVAINGVSLVTATVTTLTATTGNITTVNATDTNATNTNTGTVKATGVIANTIVGVNVFKTRVITVLTSATNYTMTPAQLLGGIISDTTATNAISVTLPTVTNVVAAISGWKVGTSFDLFYRNPGTQAVTLYTDANTQWTIVGTNTIAAANSREYSFVVASNVAGNVVCKGVSIT
jgi:hypothetical protein